jgi:hypothetical protein
MAEERIKGLARALRIQAMRKRGTETLSRQAEEALFRVAEVLSEGSLRESEGAWFGSTMITFDLDRLAAVWRCPLDDDERARLRDAVEGSVRVRIRAMRLACEEVARRLPDRPLGTAQVETRVHLRRGKLHLDVDLEVPFGVSSGRKVQ